MGTTLEPPKDLWQAPPADSDTSKAFTVSQSTGAMAQATAGVVAARGETASSAVAAQAKAQVEARYLMALQQPRSYKNVRVRLLDACRRPGFAATARYAKPIGDGKVVGWSIRFAEEVARSLSNVLVESTVVFDNSEMRILRVMVTDLEVNLSYPTDVSVRKTIERKFLKKGQQALSSRANSKGEIVYIIEATDDDVLNKQNALVSKAMRTGILRIVPGDILEECEAQVMATLKDADATDPSGNAKKVADMFYARGVMPTQLETVLGHPLEQTTPAELTLMREWLTALKEGEATWSQIEEEYGAKPVSTEPTATNGTPATGNEALRNRLRKNEAK